MHPLHCSFAILILMLSSACSTVIEGRSQEITVKSSPEGAQCLIKQADDIVARITTPGTAEVQKTKNDLVILCSKAGYESVSATDRSGMALATLGNMAFYQLSFIGNAVDSLSGASNKYDADVFVQLMEAQAPAAFPAPPAPPTVIKLPASSLAGMSVQAPLPTALLSPEPVAKPLPAAASVTASFPNPPLHAASELAEAVRQLPAGQQMAQISYAQEAAEAPHRPPFE